MARSNSVSQQIDDILTTYTDEVHKTLKSELKEQADETKNNLRRNSPKRVRGTKKGAYAKSWDKKPLGDGFVVYNRNHYRLTHLLENGHVVRNGKGTYGRAPAIKHIEPELEEAERSLTLKLESRLR